MILRILELTCFHLIRVLELIFLFEKNSDLALRIDSVTSRLERTQEINTVLQRQVKIDPLTRLYNKDGLDEEGAKVFEYCKEKQIPLSCLYVDLDYFKRINDAYGQDVGDALLKAFSQMLTEEFRGYDVAFQGNFDSPPVVGRDGGEEFVILSPYTNLEEAAVAAERLRKRLQDHVFELTGAHDQQISVNLTCTIGVSQVDFDKDKDIHALKRHSNIAAKAGKNEHRNVVAVRHFEKDNTHYDYPSLQDPERKEVPKIAR